MGTRLAEVMTTTLKVRKSATTDSAVLGLVPGGDILNVLEEVEGWVKVSVGNKTGYISADYITTETVYEYAESREEEAARLSEQAQEFNKQYEVFDKRLMYGVDVLSCVNKAISNNEKYVMGSWLSGALSSTEFAIEVEVILEAPLQEEVEVYYYDGFNKEQRDNNLRSSGISFKDLADENTPTKPKFKIPSDEYVDQMYADATLNTWDDIQLETQTIDLVTDIGEFEDTVGSYYRYTLLHGEYDKNVIDNDNVFLKKLIETISTFTTSDSQLVYNNDNNSNENSTLKKWSKMEWVPAVSAFKNKKFRCEGIDETSGKPNGQPGIHYNEITGAIDKLTFVESSIESID